MNAIVEKTNGINKTITIGGIDVPMKATASSPRLYRTVFGKDLFIEIKKVKEAEEKGEDYDIEFIENLAYLFAYQANNDIPAIDEWLDQFGMFDIFTASKEIFSIWSDNEETKSTEKK